ncbi:MAG: hypothetical protein HY744_09940 [Deltaproteobacteria bacterium]|nr:hypothetical protein [Deltaproteobacteria bacterium]
MGLSHALSRYRRSGPSAEGDKGLFTKHLVEGIGQGKADADDDGQLSLRELVDYVTPRVSREASQQQRQQNPELVVGTGAPDPKKLPVAWGLP